MLTTLSIVLVILIILSAMFSGIETALMSLNMIKVRALVKQKRKGAKALMRLKENTRELLATILLGNNLVNILAASIATVLFTELFGSKGVGIATGVMTFLILVFGEITPKSFATQNAEKISLLVARPVKILSFILAPFVFILEGIAKIVMKIFQVKKESELSEEELKTIVTMGYEEGILSKEVSEIIDNLLEFGDTKVNQVMVPKNEVAFVDADAKLSDIINYVIKTPYSRYPAYQKSKDNVVGILDVDNILEHIKKRKFNVRVKTVLKEAYFVPETKRVDDLLIEFQKKKTQTVVVVDEYGEVLGIATMEDVLEEIVGDIFDKSLKKEVYIKRIGNKTYHADARATIGQIEKKLGIDIKGKDFKTIAGFIEQKLGRIPKKGEKLNLTKVSIIIEKATKQRIEEVKIIRRGKLY